MTETLAANEVLKSKQNFANYIEAHSEKIISDLLNNYPERGRQIIIPQLTSSDEGFLDGIQGLKGSSQAYIILVYCK